MSRSTATAASPSEQTLPPRWLDRLARKAVLARLRGLQRGRLTLREGTDRFVFGNLLDEPLQATITVHDPACYPDIAFGGSIGAGEAYMHGLWSCDNLTNVVRLFVANRGVSTVWKPASPG